MEEIAGIGNQPGDGDQHPWHPLYQYEGENAEEKEQRLTHAVEETASTENDAQEGKGGIIDPHRADKVMDQVMFGKDTEKDSGAGIYTRQEVLDRFAEENTRAARYDATPGNPNLDAADEELLRRLRQRDQEVRRHEQKHAAALGPYAGQIRYHYQMGPDGRAYAIGGSTEVYVGNEATPEATARKARTIHRAAMAGGEPSPADMQVAMQARQMAQQAQTGRSN
jgi:hypothetical protein